MQQNRAVRGQLVRPFPPVQTPGLVRAIQPQPIAAPYQFVRPQRMAAPDTPQLSRGTSRSRSRTHSLSSAAEGSLQGDRVPSTVRTSFVGSLQGDRVPSTVRTPSVGSRASAGPQAQSRASPQGSGTASRFGSAHTPFYSPLQSNEASPAASRRSSDWGDNVRQMLNTVDSQLEGSTNSDAYRTASASSLPSRRGSHN